ncbi:unnamed protein product [Gongylonema pulchrum]|uniref:Low-density lipoprotein receptor domain class A n=1 Tax=Gongylonema pulchrum TaxID=637853 RepID=A0A183CUA8_9BILA|nr:unnamed protein product [Gongylonema pulchrum]
MLVDVPPGADVRERYEVVDAGTICSNDQYQCKNGQCIEQSAWCDRRIDCADGSDETQCYPVKEQQEEPIPTAPVTYSNYCTASNTQTDLSRNVGAVARQSFPLSEPALDYFWFYNKKAGETSSSGSASQFKAEERKENWEREKGQEEEKGRSGDLFPLFEVRFGY